MCPSYQPLIPSLPNLAHYGPFTAAELCIPKGSLKHLPCGSFGWSQNPLIKTACVCFQYFLLFLSGLEASSVLASQSGSLPGVLKNKMNKKGRPKTLTKEGNALRLKLIAHTSTTSNYTKETAKFVKTSGWFKGVEKRRAGSLLKTTERSCLVNSCSATLSLFMGTCVWKMMSLWSKQKIFFEVIFN